MDSNMPITAILYGKDKHTEHKPKKVVRRAGTRVFELIPREQFEALVVEFPGLSKLG